MCVCVLGGGKYIVILPNFLLNGSLTFSPVRGADKMHLPTVGLQDALRGLVGS